MTNEQIQQMVYSLNEKAGIHWTNEDKIKFAKLIVRKVFDCIADEGFEVYEPVIQSVKERFGIEEC